MTSQPTPKQEALLSKLLSSRVFSDEERAQVKRYATTRERTKEAIDRTLAQISKRKAAAKQTTTTEDDQ